MDFGNEQRAVSYQDDGQDSCGSGFMDCVVGAGRDCRVFDGCAVELNPNTYKRRRASPYRQCAASTQPHCHSTECWRLSAGRIDRYADSLSHA